MLPDTEAASRDLGIAALANSIGNAVGALIAAQVVVLTGSYRLVWLVALLLVLVAARRARRHVVSIRRPPRTSGACGTDDHRDTGNVIVGKKVRGSGGFDEYIGWRREYGIR